MIEKFIKDVIGRFLDRGILIFSVDATGPIEFTATVGDETYGLAINRGDIAGYDAKSFADRFVPEG